MNTLSSTGQWEQISGKKMGSGGNNSILSFIARSSLS